MPKAAPETRNHPFFFLPEKEQSTIISYSNKLEVNNFSEVLADKLVSGGHIINTLNSPESPKEMIKRKLNDVMSDCDPAELQNKQGDILNKFKDPRFATEKATQKSRFAFQKNRTKTFEMSANDLDACVKDIKQNIITNIHKKLPVNDYELLQFAQRASFGDVWKQYKSSAENLKVEAYTKAKNAKEVEASMAELDNFNKAATKIQKVVRGKLKSSKEGAAATTIQKVIRGQQTRDRVQEVLDYLPGVIEGLLADRAAAERHKKDLSKAIDQFNKGSIGKIINSRGEILPLPPKRKPPVPGGRTI